MVVGVRLVTFVFVFLVAELRAQDSESKPSCVCVWDYLCVNGTVNQDGTGLINPRSGINVACSSPGQVCCSLEQTNDTGSSIAPILMTTTPTIEISENEPIETSKKPDPETSDDTSSTPSTEKPTESTVEPNIVIEDQPKPVAHPVFVPKPGCGVKRVQIQQRISFNSLDESIAQYAEFPWMLAILSEENSTVYKFQCGASLIHKQVALTAAHCVDSLSLNSLRVRAGEWNIKSTEEPQPHQDRRVSRVELHPFYDPDRLRHDIALIFLESPFNITDNVDTICLPDPNTTFHGLRCTVTGWGKDSKNVDGTYHDILHKVEVPVVPGAECENRLRKTKLGPFFKLHRSAMCAGGEPDKDSCKGDGGGPLICPTTEENHWVQAGIVSWGVGCGTTVPGVYTDVSVDSGWIHRNLYDFENVPTNPHHPPMTPHNPYPGNFYNPFLNNPFYRHPSKPYFHFPRNNVPRDPNNHFPNYGNYPHNSFPFYDNGPHNPIHNNDNYPHPIHNNDNYPHPIHNNDNYPHNPFHNNDVYPHPFHNNDDYPHPFHNNDDYPHPFHNNDNYPHNPLPNYDNDPDIEPY